MAPLTIEELLEHPEYNHTVWHLKPEKQGKVAVANDRGGPINIAYEVHGHGDRHLVVSDFTFVQLPITQAKEAISIMSIRAARFEPTPTMVPSSLCSAAFRFVVGGRLNVLVPRFHVPGLYSISPYLPFTCLYSRRKQKANLKAEKARCTNTMVHV